MPSTSLEMDSKRSPTGFRAAFRSSWIYSKEPLDFPERLLAPCAQTGFLDGCSWILDLDVELDLGKAATGFARAIKGDSFGRKSKASFYGLR